MRIEKITFISLTLLFGHIIGHYNVLVVMRRKFSLYRTTENHRLFCAKNKKKKKHPNAKISKLSNLKKHDFFIH